jgi:thiamine-monophosphate kinase
VRCGIDVSDGLLQDAAHICDRSRLRAVIRAESLPLSTTLRTAYPEDALRLACTGGEDYQLLLAGPASVLGPLAAAHGLSLIGELREGSPGVDLLGPDGRPLAFEQAGWDHLREAPAPGTRNASGR